MSLISEIMKRVGYEENPGTCKTCQHSEEKEEGMEDRAWYRVCKVCNLQEFIVKDSARCSEYAPAQRNPEPTGSQTTDE